MTSPPQQLERQRDILPENLGFGVLFSAHVVTATFRDAHWSPLTVLPREHLTLPPTAMALHYGQAIFEGLKARRQPEGGIGLFRVADCATRFNRSAERLAMPPLPGGMFLEACRMLASTDHAYVPSRPDTSLYLRPMMIATEDSLGVRPAAQYLFVVLASPVDGFFSPGKSMIDVLCARGQVRAAAGGTGAAKCCGNYAAALASKAAAVARGYDDVLWLDAREQRWVEEFSAMNFFAVKTPRRGVLTARRGAPELVTPPLTGTILPGHVRDTVLTLARRHGLALSERPVSLAEVINPGAGVTEVFATGTAAGVAPVRSLTDGQATHRFGDAPGPVTQQLAADYESVVHGNQPPEPGWMHLVTP